jgi:mono/diheme cytochrome c family protein
MRTAAGAGAGLTVDPRVRTVSMSERVSGSASSSKDGQLTAAGRLGATLRPEARNRKWVLRPDTAWRSDQIGVVESTDPSTAEPSSTSTGPIRLELERKGNRMKALLLVTGLVAAALPNASRTDPVHAPAAAQDTLGKAIFTGKGMCTACHGPDAKGTALAPDLTDAKSLHTDGTVASIAKVIQAGVPTPKEHPAPMPPRGGAQLTDPEIQAVASYVASLSKKPAG